MLGYNGSMPKFFGRGKKKEEEPVVKQKERDEPIEGEIIAQWDPRKIGAAAILLGLILGGIIYIVTLPKEGEQVLGKQATYSQNEPAIKVPNSSSVEAIIADAKKTIADLNVDNVIESQGEIKRTIDNLEKISETSSSAKALICSALCKN